MFFAYDPSTRLRFVLACSLSTLLLACSDPIAQINNDSGVGPTGDGGGTGRPTPPETPYVQPIPTRIPYPVITIKGAASGAERVILMQNGKNPIAQPLGADGSFCFDMPADDPGDYTYSLEAHANGLVSDRREIVMVTMDPAAPVTTEIENLRTCSGADPEGCRTQVEDCNRIGDEDCNGLADAADPVCSTCTADYLEPNDTAAVVPGYEPDVYDGLTLCANEVDYYGVNLDTADAVNVRVLFSDAEGNLDLELLPPGGGEALIASTTTTDDESVFYRALQPGKYLIRVFGRTSLDTASYSLRISVTQ